MQDGTDRQYKLLNQYLELMVERDPVHATRKEISMEQPILQQAQEMKSKASKQNESKVVFEHTVGENKQQQ